MVRANQLFYKLGNPYSIDKMPGGVIIWRNVDPYFLSTDPIFDETYKPTNVYSKLMIKDEQIPHIVPAPHTDWFYAFIFLDIPTDRVHDVRELTESIGYDTMSKEAYARCYFMPANLTSLYLMKQLARGHKNLLHAQQEYVVLISTLAMEEKQGHGLMSDTPGPWHKTLTHYLFDL